MVDQPEILKHHPNLAAHHCELGARQLGYILSKQVKLAGTGPVRQKYEFQQRRFASTGWAGQKMKRALIQRQINIVQDVGPTIII